MARSGCLAAWARAAWAGCSWANRGRKVAIKVVHPHYASDPEFRRRFAREVAAARRVGGFHTAAVVGADPGADPPWMATAYIPGPSLAEAIAQGGPLDEAGVRRLGAALAEGLAAIHDCGLIHRDLKPGNRRDDLGSDEIEAFATTMWAPGFAVSVTREQVRSFRTPMLVLPGVDEYHPAETGHEIAALAPAAEVLEPWKDPRAPSRRHQGSWPVPPGPHPALGHQRAATVSSSARAACAMCCRACRPAREK